MRKVFFEGPVPFIEQSPEPHSAGKSVNLEGGGAGAGGSGAQGVRLVGLLPQRAMPSQPSLP